MANTKLLERIAKEVEILISQNRIAVARFREQLEVFNKAWIKYWGAKENELPILIEQPDKTQKKLYEYDRDFKCWFPKDLPTPPPDPTNWELKDKPPCYYATLAVVYDSVKSKVAPFMLCEGILDNLVFGYMQILLSRAWGFDKDMLETALNWVKADIREQQEKGQEASVKAGETKETSLAEVPISKLIQQSESHTLEFKEIRECNTRKNRKNSDILFPSLKTIAGFLNVEGGILLIGVDNSGKIVGIEPYLNTMQQGNNDTFHQQIRNCLRDRFEPLPIGKVKVSFEKFQEGTICRVDVQRSGKIIHLDGKVYVREGNTTQELKGRDLTDWTQQR